MPRRKTKQTATRSAAACRGGHLEDNLVEDATDLQVDRSIAAIRAIRDVEIEHTVTELRLLRSCMSEEQLDTVALRFLGETLSNPLIGVGDGLMDGIPGVKGELTTMNDAEENIGVGDGLIDGIPGVKGELTTMNDAEERILASMRFRDSLAAVTCLGGLELQSGAGKDGVLRSENLLMNDLVLDEQLESRMLGRPESLETPGFASQRLSIGATPKTLRMPKPGEMILSVHGSPLGIYRVENMESIHESDEG